MLLVISYPKPVRNRDATKWLIHFIYLEQHISVSDVEHNNLSNLEKFSKKIFFSFLKISFLVIFFSWSFVVFFVFFLWLTLFCCNSFSFPRKLFSFATTFFLLQWLFSFWPQAFFFCRGYFLYAVTYFFFFHEHFSFAARIFLLPRAFFMPWPICLSAASIFLLLGAFFFCRDICGPP